MNVLRNPLRPSPLRAIVAPTDLVNVAAVGAAALAAHCAPYLTLLAAYAVLGPAHYLTEISWLHQRRYFVARGFAVGGCLAVLAMAYVLGGTGPVGCAALAGALGLSIAAAAGASALLSAAATLGAMSAGLAFGVSGSRPLVVAAILIPTAVHVLAFTMGFVVRGARKTRRPGNWSVLGAIGIALASFVAVPTTAATSDSAARIVTDFFGPTLGLLGGERGMLSASGAAGLLAFGYTYHYLNWFSKTTVVGWHRQQPGRLVAIAATCLMIGVAYVINFRLGFLLSIPLSVAHVFLELPLNATTFGIGRCAAPTRPPLTIGVAS